MYTLHMLKRAPCHCNRVLQNSTYVAQILYQHVDVCRHSYIQASWDMCSIGGVYLNNVCAFCMHLRATVVQHLLGKCHSPLHSSCLIKVTLVCKVPKETVRLPAEQAAQEQSTKQLPKLRILFHGNPYLFLNHRERQIKNVFVSAELIVVAA